MSDNLYKKQYNIFNPDNQRLKFHIIGVGSTGSFITLNLSKMGFDNICVYDYDVVEEHNIPNQFFRYKDIGTNKVEASANIIYEFNNKVIAFSNEKIESNTVLEPSGLDDIYVICVDNMETRKLVYNKIKDYPIKLLDTRFGGEGYSIQIVDLLKENEKRLYEESLDWEIKETGCGEKGVIYTIMSLASEVCNICKKMDKRENYPKLIKREMKTYKILGK